MLDLIRFAPKPFEAKLHSILKDSQKFATLTNLTDVWPLPRKRSENGGFLVQSLQKEVTHSYDFSISVFAVRVATFLKYVNLDVMLHENPSYWRYPVARDGKIVAFIDLALRNGKPKLASISYQRSQDTYQRLYDGDTLPIAEIDLPELSEYALVLPDERVIDLVTDKTLTFEAYQQKILTAVDSLAKLQHEDSGRRES